MALACRNKSCKFNSSVVNTPLLSKGTPASDFIKCGYCSYFGTPMVLGELQNHATDCYFYVPDANGSNRKK